MSETDLIVTKLDAYLNAYDEMQHANDLAAANKARAELFRSIADALARVRNAGIEHGLTVAIQHLNSSPYNLTKAECVELVRTVRDGVLA